MKKSLFVVSIAVALIAIGLHGIVIALPPDAVPLEDLPGFVSIQARKDYRVDPYLLAAAKLQKLGMEKAVEILRHEARQPTQESSMSVIVLCRMLFSPKPGAEFRRPQLGASFFIGQAVHNAWKLEPIEIVDGVPFVIVDGYHLVGRAETSEEYLEYCVKNCEWSKSEFKPKSDAQKAAAMEKLLASPKWEQPLPDEAHKYLALQINRAK